MNKHQKDIIFYSNYCLHSNNLLNKISKTSLHNSILYICIDDKKIKIPKIVTRVPTLYLVKNKKVLIENQIDEWIEQLTLSIKNKNKQLELQKPPSSQIKNMEEINSIPNSEKNNNIKIEEDLMAYHGNEMGSSLSTNYSFLESTNNNSLNHNFTFINDNNNSNINTPKDFNNNNEAKSEVDLQYEKLMETRQGDSIGKGIQRI
tara:strand:+ start:2473 stop:3084 length:612 start_codon:yes stop_codon:yes gene_type:complete